MKNKTAIEALELFIEQADRLGKSSFYKYLEKQGRVAVILEATKGGKASVTSFFPDEDSINGFLMPLRLLIQKRDRCSYRALSKLIPTLPISDELKQSFMKNRDDLNSYLDGNTMFSVDNEGVLTRRRILWVILYGKIAHADPDYRPAYNHWMKIPIISQFIMGEFVNIILSIGDLTRLLAENTIKEILDELKNSQ